MLKFIKLLKTTNFESGTKNNPQFNSFYRSFMADMKRALDGYVNDFEMHKGHFYAYGFFKTNYGETYYFSISDVRFFPNEKMLVRTTEHFAGDKIPEHTQNQYIALDENFENNIQKFIMKKIQAVFATW